MTVWGLSAALTAAAQDEPAWWLDPQRLLQTNLREIDATMDIERYLREVKEFGATVVLFNVGGIVANFPTDLEFHWRNPFMKGDLVGLYNHSGQRDKFVHPPIPIRNLQITLNPLKQIKSVRLLQSGRILKIAPGDGEHALVTVPELAHFEAVLFEYE